MKRLLSFFTIALLCVPVTAIHGQPAKQFTSTIKGMVIDQPDSKAVLICRLYDDMNRAVEIPVVDGSFEYELVADTREMYQLAFSEEFREGAWRPAYFFAEPGVVELILYPRHRSYYENRVSGGILNTEYEAYHETEMGWRKEYQYGFGKLTDQGYQPMRINMSYDEEKQEEVKTVIHPDTLSEKGKRLHAEYLELDKRCGTTRRLSYFKENPSLVTYALLFNAIDQNMFWGEEMVGPYVDAYLSAGYAVKYPDHPYTRELESRLYAYRNLKVGGKYIDFTLPDTAGKKVVLSDYIDGKIALIDMWKIWCGSCRRKSISVIPVYNEFKDKGFMVVGVSGDKSMDDVRRVVEQDSHPWTTLVDLKEQHGIWSKYGIANAGGGTWLLDRDGTILAVDPSAEELRQILAEKL